MRIKKENLNIYLILLLGLVLRIWGVNFGLPYQFHQDEPIIVNHALAYGTGDFNPHFFIIPPLTSYILFFLYGIYFLILQALGIVKTIQSFAESFFINPTPFYLIGRICLGVIPSLFSVLLIYKLGLRLFNRKAALFSALFMSVAFLNVVNAHYLYTDNLLVMFVLLAYLSFFNIRESPMKRNYLFAGIFIGLSMATKYNAAILFIPLLYTHIISKHNKEGKGNKDIFIAIGAATLIFIICNPFSLFDFGYFSASVPGKIKHFYMGFTHHFKHSLFQGMGLIAVLFGITGLLLYLKRNIKSGLIILLFPVIFYFHLIFASQPFSRYVLVLVPFISFGLSYLLFIFLWKNRASGFYKFLIYLTACAILAVTFAKSIKADLLFSLKDTRVESKEWIEKNVPANAKIALDHTFFRPQISQNRKQLMEKTELFDKQPELSGLKNEKFRYQIRAFNDPVSYELYFIAKKMEHGGIFFNFWPVVPVDLTELKQLGIEYVVFDNMNTSEENQALHREVANKYSAIAYFSPYYGKKFRFSYDNVESTCLAINDFELFSRKKPGPYIIIYKIK